MKGRRRKAEVPPHAALRTPLALVGMLILARLTVTAVALGFFPTPVMCWLIGEDGEIRPNRGVETVRALCTLAT